MPQPDETNKDTNVTPPAKDGATNDDASKKMDTITDTLNNIQNNMNDKFEAQDEKIEGLKPEPDPEPESKFQPKNWDEFPELAKEEAKKAVDEYKAGEVEKVKKAEDDQTAINKYLDDQIDAMEKDGTIPSIKNAGDTNDEGRAARREIYGIAAKLNTNDLKAAQEMRKEMADSGKTFDAVAGKFTKAGKQPAGAGAPVASSSSKAGGIAAKPSYDEIHNSDMDDLIEKYGE